MYPRRVRPSWLILSCLCLPCLLACGSDDAPGETGEAGTSGEGDGDTTASADADADGDGDGDGDTSGDGDGDDSGDGDGDTSGDGDGDGDATGDGDGDATGDGDGDPGNVGYSAVAMPGGLDRVFVDRHDLDADLCTRMVLVYPLDLQNFAVDLPPSWSIESVTSYPGADCATLDLPEPITSGTGTITFLELDMFEVYPCSINVDVVFELAGDPPTMDFLVSDLVVAGAC